MKYLGLMCAASIAALAARGAQAQTVDGDAQAAPQASTTGGPQQPAGPTEQPGPSQVATTSGGDIVVTGIRQSLEKAAQIKQNAVQVVDSIVAQDIGKLPDPTTAAALQRVPGIQVQVNRNNELGNVKIRGLDNVLTTVNGREVFTTNQRTFDLQDVPAEALARVDVYKSQTPDLIEGGLAGVIDLELNKPFNFNKPTVVLAARGNYGVRADRVSPQVSGLATDRFNTGIGEIGVLVNGTWSRNLYERDETILSGVRSSSGTPLNNPTAVTPGTTAPGYLLPNIMQNFPEQGQLDRTQANASIQWQANHALQIYVDGLYTDSNDRGAHYGANVQPYTTGSTVSNIVPSTDCFLANVTTAGQYTAATTNQQTLCYIKSATFNKPVSNQTTQARHVLQTNKSIAGGATYDHAGLKANVDVSYQTSRNDNTGIVADIGQRLTSLTLLADVDGTAQYTVPGDQLASRNNLYIRNSFQQNFTVINGHLFATKFDVQKDLGGILSSLKIGARYAKRTADSLSVVLNTAFPGGNLGTATEATAVRVTALPDNFLSIGSPAPGLNGGASFYVPNPDFLLSDTGLDTLRTYVGLPTGRPAYQKNREFDGRERSLAAYAELNYKIPITDAVVIDGVLGGRFVQTDRDITSFGPAPTYTPVAANTRDRDFLPTATARLKFDNGLQARLDYGQTLVRPDFTALNPVVTLSPSNNPFVQSGGSGGNPSLKEQKSSSYDAALEYYFHGGYVAVAGYYRDITNRVITSSAIENYGGVDYNVSRPRNLSQANLKGLEVSGQYFLDFLPGVFSGLGLQGAFTLADSKVEGSDTLAGNPLQGVSKYNYTAGLLYDKHGLSGRLIYTYKSKYYNGDQTGSISVRPVGTTTLLPYVRPAGRLDFSVGYDFTPKVRLDVGGTNVLRNQTKDYLGQSFETFETFYDETTYTVGIRVRI